jgi:integrase
MATLSLKLIPTRRLASGGLYIYICLTHKRQARYINTLIEIEDLYQFENGQVCYRKDAKQLNQKLAYLMGEYREALDSVNVLKYSDCTGLREALDKIVNKPTHMTLSQLFDWRVQQFREEKHEGTAKMYLGAKKIFLEILGDCPIEYITPYDVRKIITKAFAKRGYNDGYTRILMAELKASINAAIDEGLVKFDEHPFRGYTMPSGEPRLMDLTLPQFTRVVNYSPRTRRETVAKDMLLLSFYLGGINLADLVKADLSGSVISYTRQKTASRKQGMKTTLFTIQPEARVIINKYINEQGVLSLFPERSNYESVRSYINKGLREMNEQLHINTPFSFYTARKTFAQFAFLLEIPTEIIEYCIGQSMKKGRPIYNYIRVMQKQADDAVRKVIDYTISGMIPAT